MGRKREEKRGREGAGGVEGKFLSKGPFLKIKALKWGSCQDGLISRCWMTLGPLLSADLSFCQVALGLGFLET